jgi:hypothetical protein
MTDNIPEGFILEDQMIYRMRKKYPGLGFKAEKRAIFQQKKATQGYASEIRK